MYQLSLSLEELAHQDVQVIVTQNAILYVVELLFLLVLLLFHQASLLAHNSLVVELHVNPVVRRAVANKILTKL